MGKNVAAFSGSTGARAVADCCITLNVAPSTTSELTATSTEFGAVGIVGPLAKQGESSVSGGFSLSIEAPERLVLEVVIIVFV
jgi:hypothetical protein